MPKFTTNPMLPRHYREQAGLTQLQLATRAAVSERVVRKAEAGGTLEHATLDRIAAALSSPQQPLTGRDLCCDPLAVAQAFVRGYMLYREESPIRCAHLFHSDVVLVIHTDAENLAFRGEFHGAEGIRQMIVAALSQFEHVEYDLGNDWFSNGHRVAGRRKEVLRSRATGEVVTNWILHEYDIRDGRIARIDNYLDSLVWSRGTRQVSGVFTTV